MKRPALLSYFIFIPFTLAAAETQAPVQLVSYAEPSAQVDISLAQEARAVILKANDWLVKTQAEDGNWSRPSWPALTALPLWALSLSKDADPAAKNKAVDFILSKVNKDGSIYDPKAGLRNYNTALSMVALNLSGRSDAQEAILKARRYLAKTQHLDDTVHRGGMGYDLSDQRKQRNYADLSNSYIAMEAMRLTEQIEDLRQTGGEKADINWDAAIEFLERTQNRSEVNKLSWVSDQGGHVYRPDSNQVPNFTNESGVTKFNSYGSMTYAGMLSFIYAEVDRNDPRVRSSFDWAMKHWSLDENPGAGQQGRYYFYNVLTKALAAFGQDILTLPDGKKINWREAVIKKLISLQQVDDDGTVYWVNEEDRWFESDKTLVTAYALIALNIALY